MSKLEEPIEPNLLISMPGIRKLARTLSQSGKTNKSAADIDSVDKSKSKKGKGS